jgi:hypothetical protein
MPNPEEQINLSGDTNNNETITTADESNENKTEYSLEKNEQSADIRSKEMEDIAKVFNSKIESANKTIDSANNSVGLPEEKDEKARVIAEADKAKSELDGKKQTASGFFITALEKIKAVARPVVLGATLLANSAPAIAETSAHANEKYENPKMAGELVPGSKIEKQGNLYKEVVEKLRKSAMNEDFERAVIISDNKIAYNEIQNTDYVSIPMKKIKEIFADNPKKISSMHSHPWKSLIKDDEIRKKIKSGEYVPYPMPVSSTDFLGAAATLAASESDENTIEFSAVTSTENWRYTINKDKTFAKEAINFYKHMNSLTDLEDASLIEKEFGLNKSEVEVLKKHKENLKIHPEKIFGYFEKNIPEIGKKIFNKILEKFSKEDMAKFNKVFGGKDSLVAQIQSQGKKNVIGNFIKEAGDLGMDIEYEPFTDKK